MKTNRRPASVGTSATAGSAFLLVKRCPDGRYININFDSEAELREHLVAMWECTPGYSVVAVVTIPNVTEHRQGARQGGLYE